MWCCQKSCNFFTFVFLFKTFALLPGNAEESPDTQTESPLPPVLSILAHKMQGACPNPNITTEYTEACSNSSLTIYSEDDQLTASNTPYPIRRNVIIKVKQQKDLLMTELIIRSLHKDNKIPRHHPSFGLDLLSVVMGIYSKSCPLVPASFIQTIYHSFVHLHWLTAHNRKEYLRKREQKWISKLILNCMDTMEVPLIMKDTCSETVMNMRNCSNYICTGPEHEFKLVRTDPIVDVVYKSMELVQSVCFPSFKQSYRMFHFFHLAIMDLFTEDIRIRWATQLEDTKYWKRLLGPGFENHLINLERCSEGIIAAQRFHYRIPRSSLPARVRFDGTPQRLQQTR